MWCHSLPYWTCDSCEPFILAIIFTYWEDPLTLWQQFGVLSTCVKSHFFFHICRRWWKSKATAGNDQLEPLEEKTTWIDILKSISLSQLERCVEIFSRFLLQNDESKLKWCHVIFKPLWRHLGFCDTSNELTGSQVLLRLVSGTWSTDWAPSTGGVGDQRGSCAPAPSSLVCDEKKGKHRGRSQLASIGGNILYIFW